MALQTSGAITLDQIHIEAGGTTGSSATLNDDDIRGLIGVSSGSTMSFNAWYGASNAPVFSTVKWSGDGSASTLVTGVDMTGDAMMVTHNEGNHKTSWWDTTRGITHPIGTNFVNGQSTDTVSIDSFNSDGFTTLAKATSGYTAVNGYPSRTRDQWAFSWGVGASFFDMVHFDAPGDGQAYDIAHNLGVAPEMMYIQQYSNTDNADPILYHKSMNSTPEDYFLSIYRTIGISGPNSEYWNSTAPTSTHFSLGSNIHTNPTTAENNGAKYSAYLFASIAGFCDIGSYVGNGTSNGTKTIDCGFTNGAAFVWIRTISSLTQSQSGWFLCPVEDGNSLDDVRGDIIRTESTTQAYTQSNSPPNPIAHAATGFVVNVTGHFRANRITQLNQNGITYMYYAIARQ
tara:strand:- start:165 stop:1364 length:1200 start_codon:yes stop_codon:yes gene_type:complete